MHKQPFLAKGDLDTAGPPRSRLPYPQEVCASVGDHAIALHFTKSQASVPGSAWDLVPMLTKSVDGIVD